METRTFVTNNSKMLFSLILSKTDQKMPPLSNPPISVLTDKISYFGPTKVEQHLRILANILIFLSYHLTDILKQKKFSWYKVVTFLAFET